MENELELDVRKQNSPLPIIRTDRMLQKMYPGQTLCVVSADPSLIDDMMIYCKESGDELIGRYPVGRIFHYKIQKGYIESANS